MGNKGESSPLIRWLRPLGIAVCVAVLLIPGVGNSTRADLEALPGSNSGGAYRASLPGYQTGVSVCRQAANMVLNAGFEEGLGAAHNWEKNRYCTYETSTTSRSGSAAAYISPLSFRNQECNLFTIIENLEIDSQHVYDYSAWVKAHVVDGQTYLRVSFWGSQGGTLKEKGTALTNAVANTGGQWVEITGSAAPPAGAEYARIEAIVTAGAADESFVYVDDVYLGKSVCLQLDASGSPDPVLAGGTLAYTLHYANVGRGRATHVQIRESYDRHVEWVSAQPPPSVGHDTWLIPELGPSEDGTIAVLVDVDGDLPPPNRIFNTVEASSSELADPIRRTIATQVEGQPGACKVEISLAPDTQATQPGIPARYEVQVMNTGDRDGEVTLTADSSCASPQCDPERFPLHAGASRQAAVTVDLVDYVPNSGMHQDVTSVTATLVCGEQGGRDESTRSVVTTIVLPCHLPLLAKDHDALQCRKEAWETESAEGDDNDHYWTADGPLCADRGYYGTPDDGWDWFWIWLPTDDRITIDVFDHIGTGVQLVLYYGAIENMVARDASLTPPYHIDYENARAGLYYILIYTASGFDWYTPYTLLVHYR